MLDKLFSSHINNLQHALGRTTQRQSLLMGNLANVNVPGYKRSDVDFNVALEGSMGRRNVRGVDNSQAQGQVIVDDASIRRDGNSVDMERETMSIAETELRFQALTDFTAGYFGTLKNVIREGR